MILDKWSPKVVLAIVLFIVTMVLASLYLKRSESFTSPDLPFTKPMLPNIDNVTFTDSKTGENFTITTESFVPYNSIDVSGDQTSITQLDAQSLDTLFKLIVNQDTGMIDISKAAPFRNAPHSSEQSRAYMNALLARLNRASDRKFHILDVQNVTKETSFDTATQEIIDKWSCELFIQDKDSRKVHAQAYDIRAQFYTKSNAMMVTLITFMTNYFYKQPLVGGQNIFDKYFRILNPFSLQQPFFTSEDKVLQEINTTDVLLDNHHKDLKQPQYSCFFSDGGKDTNVLTKQQCDVSSGHWDKKPTSDAECPFYKANKNYPNSFGGVGINGQCEMPIGTKAVGYRFISNDPANKPWCYNCKIGADGSPGGAGPCADEQRDMTLYPELGGNPDYMFPSDSILRGQYWQVLADRGLNWSAHPTTTKDITNPSQKQPVFASITGQTKKA
jgi:hypothetical protein